MSIMTPGGPAAPAPPAPEEASAKPGADRRRILLLAGGGVALLLVLGLAWFFLFHSGGSDSDLGSAPLPAPQPSATANPSNAAGAPLKTFGGKTSRDPFKMPSEFATTSDASGTTGTTGTTGSTGSTSATGTSGSTGATGTSGSTGTSGGSSTGTGTNSLPTSSVPLTVRLKSADATAKDATLTVQPQGKKTATYHPNLGESFGTYFKLTGFYTASDGGTSCVLLQYGDASTTLCKGATLKIQ